MEVVEEVCSIKMLGNHQRWNILGWQGQEEKRKISSAS